MSAMMKLLIFIYYQFNSLLALTFLCLILGYMFYRFASDEEENEEVFIHVYLINFLISALAFGNFGRRFIYVDYLGRQFIFVDDCYGMIHFFDDFQKYVVDLDAFHSSDMYYVLIWVCCVVSFNIFFDAMYRYDDKPFKEHAAKLFLRHLFLQIFFGILVDPLFSFIVLKLMFTVLFICLVMARVIFLVVLYLFYPPGDM
jgi:hypothetical protein